MSLAALREFAELGQSIVTNTIAAKERRDPHVGPQSSQGKREGHEKRSGPVRPLIDEIQRVPQDFPIVEDYASAGNRDPDETKKGEGDGDDGQLNVLPSKGAHVSPPNLKCEMRPHDLSLFAYR